MIGKNLNLDSVLSSGKYKGKTVRLVLSLNPVYLNLQIRLGEITVLRDVESILQRLLKTRSMFAQQQNAPLEDKKEEFSKRIGSVVIEIEKAEEALKSIMESAKATLEESYSEEDVEFAKEVLAQENEPEENRVKAEKTIAWKPLTDIEKGDIENGILGAQASLEALKEEKVILEDDLAKLLEESKKPKKQTKSAKSAKGNKKTNIE